MKNTYTNTFKNNCKNCNDSIYNVGFCDSHCKKYFEENKNNINN